MLNHNNVRYGDDRVFGGKVFDYEGTYRSKEDAKQSTDELKKTHYRRIVDSGYYQQIHVYVCEKSKR